MKIVEFNKKGKNTYESEELNQIITDLVFKSSIFHSLIGNFAEELLKTKTLPTPNQYVDIFEEIHTITLREDPLIQEAIMTTITKISKGEGLKDEESENVLNGKNH